MGIFIPLSHFTFEPLCEAAGNRSLPTAAGQSTQRATVRRRGRAGFGILYADIANYARRVNLAGDVTDPGVARAGRRLDAGLAAAGGRILQREDDGVVALFDDGDRALHCAIELLRATVLENAGLERDERVWYRLAVHFGGVDAPGGDVATLGAAFSRALVMYARARGIGITRANLAAGGACRQPGAGRKRRLEAAPRLPEHALWIDLGTVYPDDGVAANPVNVAAELL